MTRGLGLVAVLAVCAAAVGWFLVGGAGDGEPSGAAPSASPTAAAPDARALPLGADTDGTRTVDPPEREAVPALEPTAPRATPPPARTAARQFLWGQVVGPAAPLEGAQVALLDAERRPVTAARTDAEGRFRLPLHGAISAATLRVTERGHAPFESGPHAVALGEKRSLGIVQLSPAVTFRGRVEDERGRPVRGAEVFLREGARGQGPSAAVLEARTDVRGRFQFDDAPAGRVQLEVRAQGHSPRLVDALRAPEDSPCEVSLPRGAFLRVVALTAGREPIPGALVRIRSAPGEGAREEEREAVADPGGRAQFLGLSPGPWTVRASADGFRPATREDVLAGAGDVVLVMEPMPCVEGVVVAPGRAPLPSGVRVAALPANLSGTWRDDPETLGQPAEPNGSFRLCALAPGTYVVRATAEGFAPSVSAPFRVTESGPLPSVTVELTGGGALELRVAGDAGGLAGAELELLRRQPPRTELWIGPSTPRVGAGESRVAAATTDAAGTARFEHLAPGEYWVLVRHPDHVAALSGPHAVRARPEPRVAALHLERGGRLKGRVLAANGAARRGARLHVSGPPLARCSFDVLSGADGAYRTAPLPPGDYRVGPKASEEPALEADVRAGEETTLDVRLGGG